MHTLHLFFPFFPSVLLFLFFSVQAGRIRNGTGREGEEAWKREGKM